MDPAFRYSDLRLALYWSETLKEHIDKMDDSKQGLKECAKNAYGYLNSYCKQIKLEDK